MTIISRINRNIRSLLKLYFPVFWDKIHYRQIYGVRCNLDNPNTFSEKLLWLKYNRYRNNENIVRLSNKYYVRDYIVEKGHPELLNKVYYIFEKPTDLNYEELPDSFVLKSTVGCGKNFFCKRKNGYSREQIIRLLKKWENEPIRYDLNEVAIDRSHSYLLHRYFICERYLEVDGTLPVDYKIYCFNGNPIAILYITDRFGGKKKKGAFFSPEWEYISVANRNYGTFDKIPSKPKCLEVMLLAAKDLSAEFPFVRIDFYDINGRPIFGEMTFFPSGCVGTSETKIGKKTMGELLVLE